MGGYSDPGHHRHERRPLQPPVRGDGPPRAVPRRGGRDAGRQDRVPGSAQQVLPIPPRCGDGGAVRLLFPHRLPCRHRDHRQWARPPHPPCPRPQDRGNARDRCRPADDRGREGGSYGSRCGGQGPVRARREDIGGQSPPPRAVRARPLAALVPVRSPCRTRRGTFRKASSASSEGSR